MLNLKNTLDGYLKNVEVIGNTIQDENNLANIRSVGDKVEGQELYKIELACYGDNILKPDFEVGLWNTGNGTAQADSTAIRTKGFLRIRNQAHLVKRFDGKLGCQVILFDENFKYLGQQSYAGGSYVRYDNILPNAKYMKINFLNTTDLNLQCVLFDRVPSNINGVEFVEFQESELEILSPVQLEKVGNVADRIICKDGVWGVEKNIGEFVLKASDFTRFNTNDFRCSKNFQADDILILRDSINLLTTKYPWVSRNTCYSKADTGIHLYDHGGVGTLIVIDLDVDDIDTFRKKIDGTLVKCIYSQPQFIPLPHDQQVKLRTFAGQTNIAFLTEIPGQIKAQVPKSLGATVNTHTEQIADLHNSLERVKKLEETTVSTIETGSSFTTVSETSNGYFEDVKLEGRTLVNYSNVLVDTWSCPNGQKTNILNGFRATPSPTDSSTALRFESIIQDLDMRNKTLKFKLKSSVTTSFNIQILDSNGQYIYYKQVQNVSNMDFVTYIKGDKPVAKIRIYINRGSTLTTSDYVDLFDIVILEGDHTNNPPSYFEGLLSVGQDVEEVSVESRNSDETQSNKKPLLYYNPTTEMWEKPILREWDTIEKHSDGKYYYHKRSEEVDYISGDEGLTDCVTDMNKTVKKISTEKVYECTNIDLMTYSGETNYIINSGAISPKSLLKVHNNISNVVKILQEKVSLLENTFIAGLKSVLSGDMYSLATILYPEDFEQNDNTEQDIMVIPE